jgi:hypothetical protein
MSAREDASPPTFWDRFERHWRRLSYTGSIIGVAIIITWLGVWLIRRDDAVGLLLTSIATLLTLVTFRHMGELASSNGCDTWPAPSWPAPSSMVWCGKSPRPQPSCSRRKAAQSR